MSSSRTPPRPPAAPAPPAGRNGTRPARASARTIPSPYSSSTGPQHLVHGQPGRTGHRLQRERVAQLRSRPRRARAQAQSAPAGPARRCTKAAAKAPTPVRHCCGARPRPPTVPAAAPGTPLPVPQDQLPAQRPSPPGSSPRAALPPQRPQRKVAHASLPARRRGQPAGPRPPPRCTSTVSTSAAGGLAQRSAPRTRRSPARPMRVVEHDNGCTPGTSAAPAAPGRPATARTRPAPAAPGTPPSAGNTRDNCPARAAHPRSTAGSASATRSSSIHQHVERPPAPPPRRPARTPRSTPGAPPPAPARTEVALAHPRLPAHPHDPRGPRASRNSSTSTASSRP
ncbi:hypothetical protein ACRAWF_31780 [Streptomyces sp. L7]